MAEFRKTSLISFLVLLLSVPVLLFPVQSPEFQASMEVGESIFEDEDLIQPAVVPSESLRHVSLRSESGLAIDEVPAFFQCEHRLAKRENRGSFDEHTKTGLFLLYKTLII